MMSRYFHRDCSRCLEGKNVFFSLSTYCECCGVPRVGKQEQVELDRRKRENKETET